ncbi:hypothetical protein GE300_12300 [Rhodobacteraceae bacterium 2CG4]|uniref:Peptidoglycan binding-like domain-containing protein n=1 Tax=Halovulum marinum TaxID=2662447 RepID=A0A6L5Z1L3_9RHOB|nr:peptidoglycan-binding domain-containing protein [Halovulum marinum]MSU90388.1 hypothetical protein [Halovulum marinum]
MPRITTPLALLRALALGLGLAGGSAAAADLALILSDGAAGQPGRHAAVADAFRAAGYEVTEALDPDRAALTALLTGFERRAADADRLVLHLTGRAATAAGLTVLLPAGTDGDTPAELLTEGVPMALFLDIAARRPGHSLLALATPGGPDGRAMTVPQGVLVLAGAPEDVDRVLAEQMLAANRTAVEIDADAEGVVFAGLVSDLLRLGAAAPGPDPAAAPAPAPGLPEDLPDQERIAWDAARDVDTLQAYRTFLRDWGQGRFADRARDRIETLETAAETAQRVGRYREIEVGLALTVASVTELERRLSAMGFDIGAPDGTIDRRTRQAVAAFQARAGLTPTGYFNTATVQRLIVAEGG